MLQSAAFITAPIDGIFVFTVGVKVKECIKKKHKELLSPLITLHIPSFGITICPKSYIGSDRMLRTVADLWELPRINTDKAKVITYNDAYIIILYCLCVAEVVECRSVGS